MRNFNINKPITPGQTNTPVKRRKDEFKPFYAKVLAVNLTNPDYEVGKIKFEPIEKGVDIPSVAVPASFGIKQYPLVGELVMIHPSPDDFSDLLYSIPANTQNNPTTNIVDGYFSQFFIERGDINPLQPYNGDTLLEGRHGQSIRFSHFQDVNHSWGGQGDIGGAITILSNGQEETEDGREFILENINQDNAIFILGERFSIPITDNSKRDSYDTDIQSGDSYIGNQALLASDRIYLNAREDSILLSAQNQGIGLSADKINIDGVTSLRIDTPTYNIKTTDTQTVAETLFEEANQATTNYDQYNLNGTNVNLSYDLINLGENATHPLIHSTELVADLGSLTTSLSQLSTALSGVTALLATLPGGQAPATALQTAANNVIAQANTIQTKTTTGNYLSTTVFTK